MSSETETAPTKESADVSSKALPPTAQPSAGAVGAQSDDKGVSNGAAEVEKGEALGDDAIAAEEPGAPAVKRRRTNMFWTRIAVEKPPESVRSAAGVKAWVTKDDSGRRVIHFSCQAVKDTFEAARKVLLGIHHEVYTDALGGPLRVRKQTADSRAWVRVEFACIASGTEGCKCKGRLSICKLGGDVFVELNGVAHSHSGRRTTRKLPLGLRQVLESIMVRNPTLPLKRLRSKAEEDLNETFDPPTARLIKHWKETWTGKYKAANKKKAAVEVPTAQSVAVSEQDAPSEEPDVRPAVPATPSGD